MQVLDLARKECQRLGGNYILGTQFEIKQFGDSGTWMVYSLTGMACVVKKRAIASSGLADSSSSAYGTIPVATATVLDDFNRKGG